MRTARRTALVMGATGAVGTRVAERLVGMTETLYVHGHQPHQVHRLASALTALDTGAEVVPVPADFCSLGAARDLVRRCRGDVGRLDLVVNAVDHLGPAVRGITDDGNEQTWQVNYLAPALVSLGLADRIGATGNGRIIHLVQGDPRITALSLDRVSSGRRYHPRWAYAKSKLALAAFTQSLAARWQNTSCDAVSVDLAGPADEQDQQAAKLVTGTAVDAVLFACTSPNRLNGAHLQGYRTVPLPHAATGPSTQQQLWLLTCRTLGLDARTGRPWNYDEPAGSQAGVAARFQAG